MDHAVPSTSASTSRVLCRLGVLLILLGLATGAAIPLFDDAPRGLAAHTAGVQNGVLLTVLGLLWDRLRLTAGLARITAVASMFSSDRRRMPRIEVISRSHFSGNERRG